MTVAMILQIATLIVPLGTIAAFIYSARAQRRKTVGETIKVRQETRDLVDAGVRAGVEHLVADLAQIRADLLAERQGRRDCDKHLGETARALREANNRIDSQDREIAQLNRKIETLSETVQSNATRLHEATAPAAEEP